MRISYDSDIFHTFLSTAHCQKDVWRKTQLGVKKFVMYDASEILLKILDWTGIGVINHIKQS